MGIKAYLRVSTAEQVNGTSLSEQRRKLSAVAQATDTDAEPEFYVDEGVSGALAMEDRPQGRALLDSLAPGDTVLVAKLDRAFRSAKDALAKADWFAGRQVSLVVADMGMEPVTNNGAGKMFFTILAALAEFERDRIKERTADGKAAKLAAGGYAGGKVPFGYRVEGKGRAAQLIEHPEEQEIIATAREARSQGQSLRAVQACVEAWHGYKLSLGAISRLVGSE